MKHLLTFTIIGIACGLWADPSYAEMPNGQSAASLEDQLKELDAGNQVPMVNSEKLYSVQQRYLPLRHKSEMTFGGGINLTGDGFLRTQQAELGYLFHFNDRWSLGVHRAFVINEMSNAADHLKTSSGAIPQVPYAISRTDLLVEYHVFYGKFRWSVDTVSYFDQYVALGPGMMEMNTGTVGAAVADVGFAFWLDRWGSARAGLKDYYYNEAYRSGATASQNLHAHLELGYLF
jgi:outer membrane beta-barrel protein